MMNKKFDGAAAPKHYESPSLAVLNVNLEMGFAQSGNQVKDMPNWAEWEDVETL
ncbi:MAG: hypothetical protein MR575_04570 [Bacteroides sp.]|nr:hypothetical protein [Bacteroides sp.]